MLYTITNCVVWFIIWYTHVTSATIGGRANPSLFTPARGNFVRTRRSTDYTHCISLILDLIPGF